MAKWYFPPNQPFNIEEKSGMWYGCLFVEETDDVLTFDYRNTQSGVRMRAQVLCDNIISVFYALPVSSGLRVEGLNVGA